MKKIIIIALCSTLSSLAQITGNKNIETLSFKATNITGVKIDLHANIFIDTALKEGMTITTDSNLFKYIGKDTSNGILHFDQLKWIQPSNGIVIKIGAPLLKYIEQDAHDSVTITNLDAQYLEVIGTLGKIKLQGKVARLDLKIKSGKVDAKNLIVTNATTTITGYGNAVVNVTNELHTNIKEAKRLQLIGVPKKITGNYNELSLKKVKINTQKMTWIPLKIKNNSWKWNSFEVIGPKTNGQTFSYGFALIPGASKKEKWSTGTRVYKVGNNGKKELLVTITKEDKNTTVKLF